MNCVYQIFFPTIPMMNHQRLTVVIESVCDLMSDNHPYSTKVKSLVLMFAEERWLQDSCRKHWTAASKSTMRTDCAEQGVSVPIY